MTGKSMDDEQFKQLLIAMKPQEPVAVKHDMFDSLMRVGVGLCTIAIVYVVSQLQVLTTDMAVMKTEMQNVGEFMETPRFDANDNLAADQRMVAEIKEIVGDVAKQVSENRHDIDSMRRQVLEEKDVLEDIEKRLDRLELKTNGMK